MTVRSFLDSNVLLYAEDRSAGGKRDQAIALLEEGFRSRRGVISTQVLKEYFVNATRKLNVPAEVARESVALYRRLTTVIVTPEEILEAIDLHRLHSLSFWDSLIIGCARKSGCRVLYSEDLQDGCVFGELKVVNPFTR